MGGGGEYAKSKRDGEAGLEGNRRAATGKKKTTPKNA